jgi:L-iditol 2-dehydrogenase
MAVNLNPLVLKNLQLQGSFSHNWPIWERVIQLMAAGLTRPELLVGLRAGLDGWAEAFDAMHQGRVIKSVLIPDGKN